MTEIIVVDNKAINRRIIRKIASSILPNAHVSAFSSPLDALTFSRVYAPDLLITDFKMAPFDGDELIRRFRLLANCADVPTLVITSFHDIEFRDRAAKAGATDFLLSPVNYQDLVTRSRNLLATRERHKEMVQRTIIGEQTAMVTDMLQVINTHLASTLEDLRTVKRDFEILAHHASVAAIFLDRGMHVRCFTPAASSLFALQASDLGRVVTSTGCNRLYQQLAADLERLRHTGRLIERYLSTENGDSDLLVQLTPYPNAQGGVDGAAVTFTPVAMN